MTRFKREMKKFEIFLAKFSLVCCFALGFLLVGALIIQTGYINNIALLNKEYILVKVDPNNFRSSEELVDNDYRQIMCLAKNIYFEARGEGERGMEAVGFVTINRMLSDKFPNTICKVVYQAKLKVKAKSDRPEDMIPYKHKCQFSWFCDGKKDTIKQDASWDKSYNIAYNMYLTYEKQNDITKGATFYHANYVKPSWRKRVQQTVVIGEHLFYRKVEYK